MAAREFVSGPWTGFFTYQQFFGEHRTDLHLDFRMGRITGSGADAVGPFVIAGGYDERTGSCWWTKSYVGAHELSYHGAREGRGIAGQWEIRPGWRGSFRIWPIDAGECAVNEIAHEEEIPLRQAPLEPATARQD
jgi:hypothetical protein